MYYQKPHSRKLRTAACACVISSGRTLYKPLGAPTEVSLLTLGQKAGLQQESLTKAKPRIGAIPFESEHKVGLWTGGQLAASKWLEWGGLVSQGFRSQRRAQLDRVRVRLPLGLHIS